ncbi:hypothetical protein NLI96_g4555 [Meripilus lineatus]|uniref:Uncharacterized protein n=1 Tax=Meripilus lineatus TaxID=2056292 RepID=A0AAD5V6D1_9APHY|nr:hypothetical protein NLI96_g4555 [Physisporinus lineatus]
MSFIEVSISKVNTTHRKVVLYPLKYPSILILTIVLLRQSAEPNRRTNAAPSLRIFTSRGPSNESRVRDRGVECGGDQASSSFGSSRIVDDDSILSDTSSHSSRRVVADRDGRPKAVRDLQLGHTRTRCSSTTHTMSAIHGVSHSRTRAMSASDSCIRGPRKRLSSLSLSTMSSTIVPKADLAAPEATDVDDLLGSFAPTSCARQHIKSLIGTSSRPRLPLLRSLKASPILFPRRPSTPEEPITPPDSPLPSICRTPSSYSEPESEYFPSLPSSAGPVTPVSSTTPTPSPTLKKKEVIRIQLSLLPQMWRDVVLKGVPPEEHRFVVKRIVDSS